MTSDHTPTPPPVSDCPTCYGFGALEGTATLENGVRVYVSTPCPDCTTTPPQGANHP